MKTGSSSCQSPQQRLNSVVELYHVVSQDREQSVEHADNPTAACLDNHLDWLVDEMQVLVDTVQPPTVDRHLYDIARLLVRQHTRISEEACTSVEQDATHTTEATDATQDLPPLNEYASVDVRKGVPAGTRRFNELPMPAPALQVAGVFFAPALVRLHNTRTGKTAIQLQGWVVEERWAEKAGNRIEQVQEAQQAFLRQQSQPSSKKVNFIVSYWRRNDARYYKQACLKRSTYGRLLFELERIQQAIDELDQAERDECHPLNREARSSGPPKKARELLCYMAWSTFPAAFPAHWGQDNPFRHRASAIRNACALARKANVPFGWYLQRDVLGEVSYKDPCIVCFELRSVGKVTFRFPNRGSGPDYNDSCDHQPERSRQRLTEAVSRTAGYLLF